MANFSCLNTLILLVSMNQMSEYFIDCINQNRVRSALSSVGVKHLTILQQDKTALDQKVVDDDIASQVADGSALE